MGFVVGKCFSIVIGTVVGGLVGWVVEAMWQVFNVKVVGTGVGTVGGAIIRLSVG